MRILHVVHGFPPELHGGTELYVDRVARAQQALGHEVHVLTGTVTSGDAGIESSVQDGLPVHRLRRTDLFYERWDRGASGVAAELFDGFLEQHRPDIVHLHHWMRLSRDLIRRSRAAGIPAVLTCHDLFPSCPRVFRVREEASFCELELRPENCATCAPTPEWMDEGLARAHVAWFREDFRSELLQACTLIAPSQAVADALVRFAQVPEERFRVLPHASIIDWAAPPQRELWRRGNGEPLRLAHWGHLMPTKGVHLLLEALHRTEGSVELELWGGASDPDYESRLEEACRGLAVHRRAHFESSDLPDLVADVAVFPSIAHETHSFVVDEAFALGMPILVSGRGALPERCGNAGLVFEPDDAQSLAGAIQRLLSGDVRLADLRAAIPAKRDTSSHVASLLENYEELRSRPPEVVAMARLPEEGKVLRATEELARRYRGELDRVQSELEHTLGACAEAEKSIRDFRARVAETEEDLRSHRERRVELDADLAAHREELERVRREYGELEGALRKAVQAESGYQETIRLLTEERDRLQEHLGHVRKEAEVAREQIADAEEQLAQRGRELEDARLLLEERARQIAGLAEERDLVLDESAEVKAEHADLLAEVQRLRAENRFALPLVLVARAYFRLKRRIQRRP